MSQNPLLIILGSTASGKTKLAVSIADVLNGEIISADSRQIFKGMDIGTGKDLAEYQINGKCIPHHLIDIKNAGEKYNVNLFKEDFYQSFIAINSRNKLPILCGGTGMYIHSILQNHELTAIPKDEKLRETYLQYSKIELQNLLNLYPEDLKRNVDLNSTKRLIRAIEIAEYLKYNKLLKLDRPKINVVVIGLQSEVNLRRERVLQRLDVRLTKGLIEEVETLLANGVTPAMLTFYGLEYKFVSSYLNNEIDFKTLKERLGIAICQFAKRQMTFFKKMEKDGVQINWLNADEKFETIKSNTIQIVNSKFNLK